MYNVYVLKDFNVTVSTYGTAAKHGINPHGAHSNSEYL